MILNLNHKNLKVWKDSISLLELLYAATEHFPKSEQYNLTSQIRRASVSVCSNIGEGCSKRSPLDRKRFLEFSRSSLIEIDTQLEISQRLKYLRDEEIKNLSQPMNEMFAMLTAMMNNQK